MSLLSDRWRESHAPATRTTPASSDSPTPVLKTPAAAGPLKAFSAPSDDTETELTEAEAEETEPVLTEAELLALVVERLDHLCILQERTNSVLSHVITAINRGSKWDD